MSDTMGAILRYKGSQVWSTSPGDSVLEAITLMANKGVGGMISERDYARKVVLQGRSSKDTLVKEIMTSPVVSVTPRHTIDECMRIVTGEGIRHLPVVDGGHLVGVVSIGDLVKRLVFIQGETIQYLQEYIAGPHAAHRS
jgi:CBS domain-containing protein